MNFKVKNSSAISRAVGSSIVALAATTSILTSMPGAFAADTQDKVEVTNSVQTVPVVESDTKDNASQKNKEKELLLHASLRKDALYTSDYFAPLSSDPPALNPPKGRFDGARKAVGSASSLINFVFDLRGFDWSKEGANAILEEKLKPNGDAAKEFLRHKEENDKELAIVSDTLQLASVTGKDDAKAQKAIEKLSQFIGVDEANKIADKFKMVNAPGMISADNDKASVDVEQKCQRLKDIMEAASDNDPVVEVMTKRLHKYNHRNKFLQITAKAVYATMGVAAFTPTLAAPIAETTLLTFMMLTGGPEQDKLLKEVYLGKCLESRASLINEKAHLAVDCYDMALHTNNAPLLACAKDLIRQMTDDKNMTAMNEVIKSDSDKAGTTGSTTSTSTTTTAVDSSTSVAAGADVSGLTE
jgi:hypothetical protein